MTVLRDNPTGADWTPGGTQPGRGRPRSEAADRAIAEAALDVLADSGIANFSIEAVAHRAGVGKATIYRRFDGRDELLSAALDQLHDDMPALPSLANARARLQAHLEMIRMPMSQSRNGRVMAQVISAGPSHPDFLAVFYERVIAPRREALVATLRAGVAEGWVAPDADLDAAAALLVGAMLYVKVWRASEAEFPATQAIIDTALAGVGVTASPANGS